MVTSALAVAMGMVMGTTTRVGDHCDGSAQLCSLLPINSLLKTAYACHEDDSYYDPGGGDGSCGSCSGDDDDTQRC